MATKAPPKRLRTSKLEPGLARFVRARMKDTGTPGVVVGVLHRGRAFAQGFGVTSLEAPDPVDEQTLFQIGSTTKTFTAAAIMRLVERGELDLDVPVRRYLRNLQFKDADVTRKVTLRHLLTHTGGWAGDLFIETGRGDDALERVIRELRKLPQLTALGSVWHYNNAGFYLAGRVLERITRQPYEQAIKELLLDPLGMTRSFFFADEAIVYRVSAGHAAKSFSSRQHSVVTPWAIPRNVAPAGGIISDVIDQLRWAWFNMGDGRTPTGTRLLKRSTMRDMQREQAPAAGIADAVGISWLLEDVDGVRLVSHGGTTHGQLSAFVMAPERDFAVSVFTNSTRGIEVYRKIVARALEQYLGIKRAQPQLTGQNGIGPLDRYQGRYIDGMKTFAVDLEVQGRRLRGRFEALDPNFDLGLPPFRLALYDGDKAMIEGGRLDGTKADFLRDERGRVRWLRFGGRIMRRSRLP